MLCNVVDAHLGGESTITTTNTSITKPNNCYHLQLLLVGEYIQSTHWVGQKNTLLL